MSFENDVEFGVEKLYPKECKALGITEEKVYDAKIIFRNVFGLDFFENIKKNLKDKDKHGFMKTLNTNLMYQLYSFPMVEKTVWLIETSNILKTFSKDGSIAEYIGRLKDNNNCYQALFELVLAKTLHDLNYSVELQKINNEGNPVEVFLNHNGINYRFECKATPQTIIKEDSIELLLKNIDKITPDGIAINIVFNDNIDTETINIGDIKNTIHSYRKDISNVKTNLTIKTSFGEVQCFCFGEKESMRVQAYFYKNTSFLRMPSLVKKTEIDRHFSSHAYSYKPDARKMVGICVKGKKNKTHIDSSKKLISDISTKVKQQKSLLDSNEEVIIVLDHKSYPNIDFKSVDLERFHKYKTLSIVIGKLNGLEMLDNSDQSKFWREYNYILKSERLQKSGLWNEYNQDYN